MKKLREIFSARKLWRRRQPIQPVKLSLLAKSSQVRDGVGDSRLEEVPFDIQYLILLALDSIDDLSALVHASPIYHQHYHAQRQFWLRHCLWKTLGRTLVDAYTVNLSSPCEFRKERTPDKIEELIAEYEARRLVSTEEIYELSTIEELVDIAKFYISVVRPFVQEYVAWARTNLQGLRNPLALSRIEEKRVVRGLYRFQLFCNVFGQLPAHSRGRHAGSGSGLRSELFKTIEPWEIEEIACINKFVERKYEAVFDKVQQDLHPDNPRFDSGRGLYTPEGAFDLGHYSVQREYLRNGIASLGLSHLLATIRTQEHNQLVDLTASNLVHGDDWMYDVLCEYNQDRRREANYSDRDKAQDNREPLPFTGDGDSAPPLAWVTIWRGTYSNLYGTHIPEVLHTWGYVMWDADRLIRTGSLAVLQEQWDWMHKDEYDIDLDPRDYM
ncbi:hypothetical protein HJFPF1_07570 [Paramyrothecium foliicola]|nr:hypothetical protein HJFPF1_07570 [Paramyrothecium foliicola]